MSQNQSAAGFVTAAVLVFGLASCSKDREEADSFRISEPLIERQGLEPMTWRQAEKNMQLEAAINDQIRFGPEAGQPGVSLKVEASCTLGQDSETEIFQFPQPTILQIGEILPTTFLLTSPHLTPLCRFQMTARNSVGSQHFFSLPQVRVRLSAADLGIPLKQNAEILSALDNQALIIPPSQWTQYRFPLHRQFSRVNLECRHHRLSLESSDRDILPLESFDSTMAQGRTGQEPPLSAWPIQNCRLLGVDKAGRRRLSALLKIEFPSHHLNPELIFPQAIRSQAPIVLGQGMITNPYPYEVRIEFPDSGEQHISVIQFFNRHSWTKGTSPVAFDLPSGMSGRRVLLPAGETIRFQVRLLVPRFCQSKDYAKIQSGIITEGRQTIGPWLLEAPASGEGPWERVKVLPIIPETGVALWLNRVPQYPMPTFSVIQTWPGHYYSCPFSQSAFAK